MALGFKRKKGDDDNAQVTKAAKGPKKKAPKRKKGNGAADLIEESVPEAIIDDMKRNDAFKVYKDGEILYVGLLLSFDSIGGLGKKAKKDEEKGRLIECINTGRILTLATPELLADDKIIIIPNPDTLEAMADFPLLVAPKLSYLLVGIGDDGHIDSLNIRISYDEALEYADPKEEATIMDLALELGADWAQASAAELEDSDSYVEDSGLYGDPMGMTEPISSPQPPSGISTPEAYQPESTPLDEPDSYYQDIQMEEEVDTGLPFEEESQPSFITTDAPITQPIVQEPVEQVDFVGDEIFEDEVGDEEEDVITEYVSSDDVNGEIERIFKNDDLGIEVTTAPFDIQFVRDNPFIEIDEPPAGWLNDYVAEMVREANASLRHMHQRNITKARNVYLSLINRFYTEIRDDLSLDDQTTQYGSLVAQLKKHRSDRRDEMQQLVANRRQELRQEWNEQLNKVGEAAALSAKRQYEERNQQIHNEALASVDKEMSDLIEAEFQEDMQEILRMRRNEAQVRLDEVTNLVINEVADGYLADLRDEEDAYLAQREDISEFISAFREDEIAHDKVVAEEQRQTEKADQVMREAQQRIEAAQSAAQAEATTLRREIEDMQRRTNEQLQSKDNELTSRLAEAKKDKEVLEERYDTLSKQYAELDSSKDREWQQRYNAIKQDRDRWSTEANDLLTSNRRTGWYAFMMAAIAAIAALAVGVLIGITLQSSQPTQVVVGTDAGYSAAQSQVSSTPTYSTP